MKLAIQQKLYDALREISKCDSLDYLDRNAEKQYGCNTANALRMAYENITNLARHAVKGVRRPK